MTPSGSKSSSEGTTSSDEHRALIALSLVPGVGPGRIRSLLARFGSACAVLQSSRKVLDAVPGIGTHIADAIASFDAYDEVEEQMALASRAGILLLTVWDEPFPRLLRQIYDPPAFLWLKGALKQRDERGIAIVGTRRASDYGRRMAFQFAYELGRRGYTVISGLAYGIDAEAHRGALEAGARTLAVLGSGVDRVYPARHVALARAITQQGAVLSEYPLGAAPDGPNFPRRNRIVSGLALGTLVVEAHETGGALITARLAVEQNREVFALPSPVHSRSGVGTNRLIQRGHAKLVLTVDDILEEIGGVEAPVQTAAVPSCMVPDHLHPVERRLYDVLEHTPQHIDAICQKTGHDSSTALVYLLNLEFKGLVSQMAGKQFFRTTP